MLKGSNIQADLMPVMLKRLTTTGSTPRMRSIEEKSTIAQSLRKIVWPLLGACRIHQLIHTTFPWKRLQPEPTT